MSRPLPPSTFTGGPDDLGATAPPLWVADLCCGCGMASLGLMAAGGFEIDSALDADYDCTEAYYLNLSPQEPALWRDCGWARVEDALQALQARRQVDVVLTGPPCQDDSKANHGANNGRGAVKAPALTVALALEPTWIVMEMVNKKYIDWCRVNGARQILKLVDCDLGGYTVRARWFAIWGPRDLTVHATPEARGWADAFPRLDLTGHLLASEADNKGKRWGYAKQPHEPARACMGGDYRHIIRQPDGQEFRLGPGDEAALSGFPHLQLQRVEDISDSTGTKQWVQGAQNERAANTMVGNGWPRSFGRAIGRAIRRCS